MALLNNQMVYIYIYTCAGLCWHMLIHRHIFCRMMLSRWIFSSHWATGSRLWKLSWGVPGHLPADEEEELGQGVQGHGQRDPGHLLRGGLHGGWPEARRLATGHRWRRVGAAHRVKGTAVSGSSREKMRAGRSICLERIPGCPRLWGTTFPTGPSFFVKGCWPLWSPVSLGLFNLLSVSCWSKFSTTREW